MSADEVDDGTISCASLCANVDKDLHDVISAWPLLPDAIKAAIAGIVRPYLNRKCLIIVHGRAPNGDYLGTVASAAEGAVQANKQNRLEEVSQHRQCTPNDD